jgi:hypothetical protein
MYRSVFVFMAGLMLGGCATYSATSGQVVIRDDSGVVNVRIDSRDRAVIESFYKNNSRRQKGMPPGLAKRNGNLPPGLAKRDELPPGLQGEPLPYELEKELRKFPSTYVRLRVGRDIVLMDRKSRVIFDVVYGVAY